MDTQKFRRAGWVCGSWASDLWLSGQIARLPGLTATDGELFIEHFDEIVVDNLFDDQTIYITDSACINIILGCTHSGVESTFVHIASGLKMHNIKLLLGGLHLFKSDHQIISKTVDLFIRIPNC